MHAMSSNEIDAILDLRGVVCPLNFVKTKLRLEDMQDGQILKVVLDNGEALQNVPRSVKEEGHRIVKADEQDDGSYTLLIRKGG